MKRMIETTLILALVLLAWSTMPLAEPGPYFRQTEGAVILAEKKAAPAADDKTAVPNIMIPDPLFTFAPVVDGMEVVHDFRVYNRGEGELAIEKIQTG